MKKTILTLLFITGISMTFYAQNYQHAVGTRGGITSGITYRLFADEEKAFEAIVSFRERGLQFILLQEYYMPVLLDYSEHFFAYYGGGGHIGYTRWYRDTHHSHYDYPWEEHYARRTSPVIGLDAIAGIEYRLYKIPFTIGFEYKPFIELFGRNFFHINLSDFGLALKYTF